jgi:hypothetical protein
VRFRRANGDLQTEDYLPSAIRSAVFGCVLALGLGVDENDVGGEGIGRDFFDNVRFQEASGVAKRRSWITI